MNLIKVMLLAWLSAAAFAVGAEPFALNNDDISAGDCEKNCEAAVLLAGKVFVVRKGAERPALFLQPVQDTDHARDLRAEAVPGELNTDDCVASCEKQLEVADVTVTARRDDEGELVGVWITDVRFGGIFKKVKRGLPPGFGLPPAQPNAEDIEASLGSAAEGRVCMGGGGTGPGDVCPEHWVIVHLDRSCIARVVVDVYQFRYVNCRGDILTAFTVELHSRSC